MLVSSCKCVCRVLRNNRAYLSFDSSNVRHLDDRKLESKLKKQFGQKRQLSDSYEAAQVELDWYDLWEAAGCFQPSDRPDRPSFSMVLPPPNVTGTLHIGHALTSTIEDVIARWRRMKGDNVVWVPGLDHAGIATQSIVERHLYKTEGLTRHDLKHGEFLKRIHNWTAEHGGVILKELRRMGASLDWTRQAYTLDKSRSDAVVSAFIRLHNEGLIFRSSRIVNWCCHLQTALSDIEVDRILLENTTMLEVPGYDEKIEFGTLHTIAYPVEGGGELLVSTSRPETIPADVALAVNPSDIRYAHLSGRYAFNPWSWSRIPIIPDNVLVDPEYGTGVVKVTPGHDLADFECAQRHDLPVLSLIDESGHMTHDAVGVEGLPRFKARTTIIKGLQRRGLYRKGNSSPMAIAVCSRSGDIIEPIVRPQWYVRCENLAKEAIAASDNGHLSFIRDGHHESWERWLGNTKDWCISRQLSWGHRVPAYRCRDRECAEDDVWIAAASHEEAVNIASKKLHCPIENVIVEQDDDVLDTWFSSALFPLSILGWPNCKAPDLCRFYPLSLMETGSDIIFFWVARMVMLCSYLHGELPFRRVMLHPLVRDAKGRKMSKSIGNVICPLEVIEGRSLEQLLDRLSSHVLKGDELARAIAEIKVTYPEGIPGCGADSLRLSLCGYMEQQHQINLDIKQVVEESKFCNKVWQATRFCTLAFSTKTPYELLLSPDSSLSFGDRWILSKLNLAIKTIDEKMIQYDIASASRALHIFFRQHFCDVYIEFAKRQMLSRIGAEPAVLYTCLETFLRLAHPFMPFITEELWQGIQIENGQPRSIMLEDYPSCINLGALSIDVDFVERTMGLLLSIVKGARSKVQDKGIGKGRRVQELVVWIGDLQQRAVVTEHASIISSLARTPIVKICEVATDVEKCAVRQNLSSTASIGVVMERRTDEAKASSAALLAKSLSKKTLKLDTLLAQRSNSTSIPVQALGKLTSTITKLEEEIHAVQANLDAIASEK